jgi:hypothetical protein
MEEYYPRIPIRLALFLRSGCQRNDELVQNLPPLSVSKISLLFTRRIEVKKCLHCKNFLMILQWDLTSHLAPREVSSFRIAKELY